MSVGIVYFVLLKSTTRSQEGDFFDSQWFWSGWLVLPAIAAGAAWIDAEGAPYWGWLLVLPQAVAVVVENALLHDPGQGASFWPLGLLFVVFLGLLASGAARLGVQHEEGAHRCHSERGPQLSTTAASVTATRTDCSFALASKVREAAICAGGATPVAR